MVFKDDVVFLIEEYSRHFGEPPKGVSGRTFPNRGDWTDLVHAIRKSLDEGKPMEGTRPLSRVA